MEKPEQPPRLPGRPPKQENLNRAIGLGFDRLADQTGEQVEWLGAEVSFDKRYRNSALARRPYSTWDED